MGCGRLELHVKQSLAMSMSKKSDLEVKQMNWLRWLEPDEDDTGEPMTEEQKREAYNRQYDAMMFGA
jgi:hypothetical protein